MLNSDTWLINGADVNIKLTHAPQAFYLLATSGHTKLSIKILGAILFITQIELKPPLLLAHANVLGMKRKAHYPVTLTQIKTFTASSGVQKVAIDNAFFGPIPERILIGLVKNNEFVGSASTNSFHFHHYMTNLLLYVSGLQHPAEPITMVRSSPIGVTRACETLFSSVGIHYDGRTHMINLETFPGHVEIDNSRNVTIE